MNGNVYSFEVTNNTVHDNNIGILRIEMKENHQWLL